MSRKWIPLLLASALLAACGGSKQADKNGEKDGDKAAAFALTILHINDHHSHLDPAATRFKLRQVANAPRQKTKLEMGGFSRVASTFAALADKGENVLKLHAGDAITGTLYYTLEKGRADADLMNTVCFDALAVGNHEFDGGDEGLKKFIDFLQGGACQTPVLSANVQPHSGSALGTDSIQPSRIVERGGERIGIVGLTVAGKTQNSSRPDAGTRLTDERAAAQKAIDDLKRQGVNKIILLSHLGYEQELRLATALSGVDVIVGGDSHSLLGPEKMKDYGLSPAGPYPSRTQNRDGDPVCVVQAWQYSAVVGELKVEFDERGRVKNCRGTPHVLVGADFESMDAGVAAAVRADIAASGFLRLSAKQAAAEAVLAPYQKRQEDFGRKTVATATQNLCLRRVPGSVRDVSRSQLVGCNEDPHVIRHGGDMQQLVAEAFLAQGKRFGGADIALQNGGGVRIDLAKGAITVKDIYTVLPFDNTLVALQMSGAEFKAAIEDGIETVAGGSTGAYPYAAGARWQVDMNRPRGERVSALEVRDAQGNWSAIKPTANYRVIANDFIADGLDGYTTLGKIRGARREDIFLAYAEAFLQYAQDNPLLRRLPPAAFSTQRFVDAPAAAR